MSISFFDDDDKNCEVVPLITCDGDKYTVDEETISWLENHKQGELIVVACAGRYRTGKSFLLNRLARAKSGHGFGVGDSVQACTKGLWLYKKMFSTERGDRHLVFVDTEGIDALDANDTHDVRIFTLALLLSSAFLYNSVGAIDETAMQTLSLMTRVTSNVRMSRDDGDNSDISSLREAMPDFYWILRDFGLRLTNRQGEKITPDEYLEEALQTSDPQKDQVRSSIRNAFSKRALITLARPSNDDQAAQHLEDRLFSVSQRFTSGVDSLRDRLANHTRSFTAKGKPITGRMYAALCRHYAKVVQTDAVPVIKDSWTLMAEVQTRDVKDAVLSEAQEAIGRMTTGPKPAIVAQMATVRNEALVSFHRRAMPPIDPALVQKLEEQLDLWIAEGVARLAIDLATLASEHLDAVEEKIMADPAQTPVAIATAEEAFYAKHGQGDYETTTWRIAMADRCLRWLPRVIQTYCARQEKLQSEMDVAQTRASQIMAELDTLREDNARSMRVREGELEQLIESKDAEIERLRAVEARLEGDIHALNVEHEVQRAELQRQITERAEAGEEGGEEEDATRSAAIDEANLEVIRLQTDLRSETQKHEETRRRATELDGRLSKAMTIHAQLQEQWQNGLEQLRAEEKRLRETCEERIGKHKDERDKTQKQLDDMRLANEDLEGRIATMAHTAKMTLEMNDREKQQLRDSATKYREQSDTAQQRVLEIHRSMLEDLRTRDEKTREQQSIYLKERAENQSKLQEFGRDNDRLKETNAALKRRNAEADSMERECKRMRTQQQEQTMIVTRLESENSNLRTLNETLVDEREKLRQENMQMEGELALLRAEKQLSDARKNLTGTANA